MRQTSAVLAATVVMSSPALAQDAHYWTRGYGLTGQLTEGAVVGGADDLAAIYYNPGRLTLQPATRVDLGLRSLEILRITAAEGVGAGLDADTTIFHMVPAMVAARLRGKDGGADRLACAFFVRHDTDWDLVSSAVQLPAPLAGGAAGYGRTRQRLLEHWAGVAWSHRFSEGLAIGITPFGVYRGQRSRRTLALAEAGADGSRLSFLAREHEYNHVRGLARLGVAWQRRDLALGLAATTPAVRLWGEGGVRFDAALSATGEAGLLAASTQRGLRASYRSPWSLAAGATWRRPRRAVHATAEWFSRVAPYAILSPVPAAVAGRSETVPLTMEGRAKSVTNVAVGFEQRLAAGLRFHAGAARDGSSWQPGAETLASWDLWEISAGVSVDRHGSRFAVGMGYGWGCGELTPTLPLAPPAPAFPGTPLPPRGAAAEIERFTVSFGFSLRSR